MWACDNNMDQQPCSSQ